MSISLNANFELLSAGLYLDDRQQFNTIIEMKDFAETSIPDGFITYNKETQKHYVFSSSNTVDVTLGKWREYNSGGGSSEKQIKDWVSGSSYLEGDYIYHEGELYRCLASNNNVDFNETNWEQLTYGIDELSKEDVEGLLGLTKEEIEAMTDLILDTEVRIDKTYSSSKIYTDIQQCLEDSKTYTLEEIAKLSGASYKVVTSTSEMTSDSIIYLLANGSTYNMYIVEENGATTKIGDMNVNLYDYYTKTEIDNDFLKKVDADGKYATITTVDGKIDKDKIATVLDDTVTDEQIPTAKAVYDKLSDLPTGSGSKCYTKLDELGITTPCTIKDIWDKMPSGSIAIVNADSLTVTDLDAIRIELKLSDGDEVYGILTVVKLNGRTTLEFRSARTTSAKYPDTFIGYCKGGDCTSIHWKQIAFTIGVVDVGATTITPVNGNITGTIEYMVKNGICYVSMKDLMSKVSASSLSISTTMPRPSINVNTVSVSSSGDIAKIHIDKGTTYLIGDFYQKNVTSSCIFSYPVAE